MSQPEKAAQGPSENVDLGQAFNLLKKFAHAVFRAFLSVYVFIAKHFFWFIGLALFGGLIGWGLQKYIPAKKELEVLVTPNMESKGYLFTVVQELSANLKSGDSLLLDRLDLSAADVDGFSVEIGPVFETEETRSNQEIKYLQLLQNFGDGVNVSDIARAELLDNTALDYRILFTFREATTGIEVAKKIMAYINSNEYYGDLITTLRENAKARIVFNDSLLLQTNALIEDYREKMRSDIPSQTNRIVLEGEQELNISELLDIKMDIVRDTEQRKMELSRLRSGVSVLYFGEPHEADRGLLGRWILLVPVLLIGMYLLAQGIKYLNAKAGEYQVR